MVTPVSQPQLFKLPDVGEGLTEAEIVKWHVQPGDAVEVNQTIVEIETAKAIVELPCPFEGVVAELMVAEGETVDVGTPIIAVNAEGGAAPPSEPPARAATSGEAAEGARRRRAPRRGAGHGVAGGAAEAPARPGRVRGQGGGDEAPSPQGDGQRRAAPRAPDADHAADHAAGRTAGRPAARGAGRASGVRRAPGSAAAARRRRAAAREAAGPEDGEGPRRRPRRHHRVGPAGVDHPRRRPRRTRRRPGRGTDGPALAQAQRAPAQAGPREERIPVKGVRKATAAAMSDSAFTAPHVTEFLQVDVTRTMETVKRLRELPEFADVKVSPLLLVARALLIAVARNPR